MLQLLILLHNNSDDSFFGFATNTANEKKKYFYANTKENNSCGPEKGQWVTIILIRASTGVCENHNHLLSEILPRSHLQILLGKILSSSSPDTKEKNTYLLD